MKKRKTYRVCDFKRWLRNRRSRVFGTDSCNCPLAKWAHEEMDYERLDKLPGWANRFVGCWDEATSHQLFGSGETALKALDGVVND